MKQDGIITIMSDAFEGNDRRVNPEWHQDKRISIATIFLLLVNLGSTIWWAADLTHDVDSIMNRPDLTERVIRIEATVEAHNRYLGRLSTVLDKMETTVARIDREQAMRGSIVKDARKHIQEPHYWDDKYIKD